MNKNFNYLWIGQTISLLGNYFIKMAIPIIAVSFLGANSFEMGILQATGTIPFFLFSLLVGVWIDRANRKSFLIYTNLLAGIVLLLIPLLNSSGQLNFYLLLVIFFIVSTLNMIFELAYLSFIPSVVDKKGLTNANSKLESTRSVSSIIGPTIAGGLITLMSAPLALTLSALSLILPSLLFKIIKTKEIIEKPINVPKEKISKDILDGLKIILKEPILKSITHSTAILNFCGTSIGALYVLYIIKDIGLSSFHLGIILGIGSVGSLLASIVTVSINKILGIGKSLILSCFLITIGSIIVPIIPDNLDLLSKIILFGAAQFISSFGTIVYFITQVSLRQSITPNHLLGRLNSSNRFISRGLMPIGALVSGSLASLIGIQLTFLVMGALTFISILILYFSPVSNIKNIPDNYVLKITG